MPPVFASGMRAAIWMASFRSRAQNQEYAHLLTVLDQWAIGRRQRAVVAVCVGCSASPATSCPPSMNHR
jgi:hypothetical protein